MQPKHAYFSACHIMLAYSAAGHPSPLGNTSNIFKYSRLVLRSGCHVSLSYEKVYFIQSCTVCRGWPPPSHCPNSCTSYKLSFFQVGPRFMLTGETTVDYLTVISLTLSLLSRCTESTPDSRRPQQQVYILSKLSFCEQLQVASPNFHRPFWSFFFYHASSTVKVPTEGLRFS